MSRHNRSSLDYFPIDTNWDLKMRLLLSKFGLEGIGAVIQLLQMIYREGYSCSWNEEIKHLYTIENRTTTERIDEILEFCFDHEIFDRSTFTQCGILTSKAIQLQWIRVSEVCHRKNCQVAPEFSLVSAVDLDNEEKDDECGNPPTKFEKVGEVPELFQQSSERNERKERKGKKEEYRSSEKAAQMGKGYSRAGDSPMMQQILRNIGTKKEKGPD